MDAAIPIFTSQLEKARESTDAANLRAAYATASANKISGNNDNGSASTSSTDVTITQTTAGWDYVDDIAGVNPNDEANKINGVKSGDTVTVTVDDSGKPVLN